MVQFSDCDELLGGGVQARSPPPPPKGKYNPLAEQVHCLFPDIMTRLEGEPKIIMYSRSIQYTYTV
jgi:hypothetical protein